MRPGAHQSIAGGVFNAIYHGRTATCETVQIFNKSNNQWRAKELKDDEVEKYFAAIEETGIDVACSHTSYLINIASPDPELSEKSYQSLKTEMERCNLLKIPDLVLHPGSHVGSGEEAGLDKVVENVNRLFDDLGSDNNVRLCLEATAGQGTNLGHKFEHLAYIIDKTDDKEHLSVCLDSCHIFAAGYDLIDPKGYKKTIKAFDDTVGLGYLRIFHLNDSKKEQGSSRTYWRGLHWHRGVQKHRQRQETEKRSRYSGDAQG